MTSLETTENRAPYMTYDYLVDIRRTHEILGNHRSKRLISIGHFTPEQFSPIPEAVKEVLGPGGYTEQPDKPFVYVNLSIREKPGRRATHIFCVSQEDELTLISSSRGEEQLQPPPLFVLLEEIITAVKIQPHLKPIS